MFCKDDEANAPPPLGEEFMNAVMTGGLTGEDLYIWAAERARYVCGGCRREPSRKTPSQVQAAVNREAALLEDLILAGRLKAAVQQVGSLSGWRLRRHELAAELIARARGVLPGSPERSEQWAILAEHAAKLGETTLHLERRAQAVAYRANARRALADLPRAAVLFRETRVLLLETGIVTAEVGADIDFLESSMARDSSQLSRAEELLQRAIVVQVAEGLATDAARSLISLSIPLLRRGDIGHAKALLHESLELLAGNSDSSLRMMALGNLCLCETRDENYSAAFQQLARLRLEARGNDLDAHTASRLQWTEARVTAGLGAKIEACELFREVFDAFTKKSPYDAILVALDWARVAVAAGRVGDVQHISEYLLTLAEGTSGIHEAAREAVELLGEALVQKAFTDAVYWRFERYFWEAPIKPGNRIAK